MEDFRIALLNNFFTFRLVRSFLRMDEAEQIANVNIEKEGPHN